MKNFKIHLLAFFSKELNCSSCIGENLIIYCSMITLNADEIQLVSGGILPVGHGIVSGCFGDSSNGGGYDGYDADEALDALIQFLSN